MLIIYDSDDDVPIQNNFNNLVVTEHSSSKLYAMFSTLKRQNKTPCLSFDMPLKLRVKCYVSFTCKLHIFGFNFE
jgi:hypothetical protein